jgi:hypothetical protein
VEVECSHVDCGAVPAWIAWDRSDTDGETFFYACPAHLDELWSEETYAAERVAEDLVAQAVSGPTPTQMGTTYAGR